MESSILKTGPTVYKYASDKEVPLTYVSHMEVPIVSQLETRKAFQAANSLHQTLLSHNYQLDLRDQSTSPLLSKPEPCPDQTCHPPVPRKSVKFTENLQIRFLIPGKDGEIIFHRHQLMKDRQTSLTFSNNLMLSILGLDVSRRKVFYQTYWSHPSGSNENFDHLNE